VFLILGGESTRVVTEFKILQLQRIQTKNKRVFIPDKFHKQNLPPYLQKVCATFCNISHIASTPLHFGLQSNDQYRTENQRLVPHPLQSNCQREEQLAQCPNLMECLMELDPGKPFSSVFWKDQEEHSTQAVRFWI
jgi:hypothetical protein